MIEIIVNSRSKTSLIELKKIEEMLSEKKLSYRVLRTSKNKTACDLMDKVIGDNLIVIGGDGTINEVINNYHGKEFVYLAYGSGNDLARSLKFDRNSIDIDKLLNSKEIDDYTVGVVNDKKFCSGFDLGFNADIIKSANKSKFKKYLGKRIYLLEGILGILKLKKYKAEICWENNKIVTEKLYLLNVMIQPFEGGGIKFAPNATGKSAELHVMIMKDMSILTFIYNYLCLLLNKHHNLKNVDLITTNRLTVTTNQEYFQIDGELVKNSDSLELSSIGKFYKLKRM